MLASKRATQLVELAEYLCRAGRWVTIQELTERFACHRSKVFRMLRDLEHECGVLLERGRLGVYLPPQNYKLNVRLGLQEVMALFLAARTHAYQQDKRLPATARALFALSQATQGIAPVLAAHIRRTAEICDQRDAHDETYVQVLNALTEAWERRWRVLVHYKNTGDLARPFDVYFIEPSPLGTRLTYVFGFDHSRNKLRTFAVERILRVTRTSEQYTIPPDFDPYALLARAWGVNWGDGTAEPTEVHLRFRPGAAAERVQESCWHPTQRIVPQADGGCDFHVRVSEPMEMLPWIRQWGPDCEVLAPLALRQRVAESLSAAAKIYA
ncbi:MAG: hypothetical protein CUN48_02945 [Candidatus Thermofonsia Clade 3 bacterium]|uniref:Uncharacterized protein n=1 Tax=Candidatus Thermofonsia Clade 3 bacterium TaxID=2364212 RepID=A0A2M8QFL2_9CHLR|nr:MAG: hypothetical protein CUN48_02945 [Candidatus Thermofonsia Clade 3 bacterium]